MKYFNNNNNEIEKTNDYNLIYTANSCSSKMWKNVLCSGWEEGEKVKMRSHHNNNTSN